MTSQLNPDAAVFVPVPVSPTRLLMMDEAIITASSGVTFDMTDSESDTALVTIEYSSGPKHVDYFMRDNFSTIPNKIKEIANATAASSITADIPKNPQEHMEHITIDQLMGIQTIAQKDITDVLIDIESEDLNVSGNNNNSATDAVGNNTSKDVLFPETTTSLKVEISCCKITEENSLINIQPDLSKDGKLCQDIIMALDEPQKVPTSQRKKSKSSRNKYRKKNKKPDSTVIENNEGFITEHRKTPPIDLTFKPIDTFSDANPFGALQTPITATPIIDQDQDQCYNLTELYKSPQETPRKDEAMSTPEITQLDISTNIQSSFILRRSPVDDKVVPFEELESPKELPHFMHPPNSNRVVAAAELSESPTLVDGIETLSPNEVKTNTENKESLKEAKQDLPTNVANAERQKSSFTSVNSKVNKLLDTTQRFLRPEYTIPQPKKESEQTPKLDLSPQPSNNTVMQDNKLNSEGEMSPIVIDIEPESLGGFDIISTSISESVDPRTDLDHKTNVENIILELNDGEINVEMQETSFTDKNAQENIELMNSILKQVEANILLENEKFNDATKTNDNTTNSEPDINDISNTTILTALDIVRKTYNNIECNIKEETKEMRLELEGNIPTSQSTPEELRNLVQGFEVINKDELVRENYLSIENTDDISEAGLQKGLEKQEIVNLVSPQDDTLSSLLGIYYDFPADESTTSDKNFSADGNAVSNNTFLNTIDKLSNAEDNKLVASENSTSAEKVQSTSTETTVYEKEKGNNPSISEDSVSESTCFLEKPASVENIRSIEKEETPINPEVENVHQSDVAQTAMNETEVLTGSLEEVHRLPITEMMEVELIVGTTTTISTSSELEGENLPSLSDTPANETGTEEKVYNAFRCISPQAITVEERIEEEEVPENNNADGVANSLPDLSSKQPAEPVAPSSVAKSVTAKTATSMTKTASGVKPTSSGKTSTVKPTSSATASTKLSASGSSSAKPIPTNSATSKPGVITSKPSATVSSKHVLSSTAPSKTNAQSAATSKLTTSGTVTPKSSTSNVTPSKSASGVAPPKPSVTSVASSKVSASTTISSKTSNTGTTSAKPAVTSGAPSKPVISSAPSSKPMTASKPAAPSSTVTGTSPPKPTSSSSTTAKPAVTTTTAKKPAATSTVKPTGTKTTTPSSKPSVVTSTSSKPVPKPLQISETTLGQKSPSKPSTPTSNPTTPTTPRSPVLKSVPSTVKSPPKPESKSSSSIKPSTSSKPAADKKPTTNNEVKPLVKKTEPLKSSTTVVTKPSAAPTKPTTPVTKVASSATKSQTPTPAKTTVAKPTSAIATKQKLDETSVGVKKSVAATVAKNSEKNSKEPVEGKSTNGKTLPTKTLSNSKTDPKVNTKNGEKPVPSKKPEEVKKEQLQEQKVSTTNEITNHTSDTHNMTQPMTHIVTEAGN